ncbi:double zinc ribbon domain-containing protein [Streptomyces violascens]|uniref:double zinc ribbon domain-containing protein n=2 Tax=Streptomyces violascens TaxID=67381 RepID=UPI001674B0A7|nr:zinc ribbon domain-containing protein [Streptomyces violascens]GGU50911.1 hypothetical protein GCM10010289_84180 [Streptomyces violascens]
MSSEIYFSNNYRDLCEQHGTGAGFQFEFHCSRCFDTWRSPFENFTAGRMASWLSRGVTAAWSVIGGRAGGGVSSAADGLAGASWGGARDAAFQRAVDTARGHFNRCGRCSSYVCGRCWNPEHGLCLHCAPDTAAEAEAARRRGVNDMASQQAYAQGQVQGEDYDPKAARQLVCPQCQAETRGAPFCGACGHRLAQQTHCTSCQTVVPDGSVFCPTCGTRR